MKFKNEILDEIKKSPLLFKETKYNLVVYFVIMDKWFAQDLEKDDYEIRFPIEKLSDQMMIIYMDVWENERKEVKNLKDFRK